MAHGVTAGSTVVGLLISQPNTSHSTQKIAELTGQSVQQVQVGMYALRESGYVYYTDHDPAGWRLSKRGRDAFAV